MRYLYTAENDELFAYAPGRRDFFRAGDDHVWAHESHDWLIAAKSGVALAHRTGDVYYGAVDGERLYRLSTDLADDPGKAESVADPASRPQRATRRVARPRR